MDPDLGVTAVRLVVAAVFGGLIGLEREMHSQPAGLRTHMVVSVGAALIMILSVKVAGAENDPGRIAAQVVSGIGFLGAGAILRFGMSVKGLTTAACLWTAAGIGLTTGAGYWAEAGIATAVVLVAIFCFDWVEKTLIVGRRYNRFTILGSDSPELISKMEAELNAVGIRVKTMAISKDKIEGKVEITVNGVMSQSADLEATVRRLSDLDGVEKVDVD